jgi:hypothetical protein
MSRATYVKHLEHIADASRKAINDLTREVYELREQLGKAIQQNINGNPQQQKSSSHSP